MKKMMTNVMRYAAAGVLSAVSAVSVIVMLAYYQEPVALIPAAVAAATFVGANMILPVKH